jgi:hypothetical protein
VEVVDFEEGSVIAAECSYKGHASAQCCQYPTLSVSSDTYGCTVTGVAVTEAATTVPCC